MAVEAPPPFEHPHDPEPPQFERPSFAMLWRGAAFLLVAVFALAASAHLAWRRPVATAPLHLGLDVVAVLAAWAGLIHVTGGEKFDDHELI